MKHAQRYHLAVAGKDDAVEAAVHRADVRRTKFGELVHPRHTLDVVYLFVHKCTGRYHHTAGQQPCGEQERFADHGKGARSSVPAFHGVNKPTRTRDASQYSNQLSLSPGEGTHDCCE